MSSDSTWRLRVLMRLKTEKKEEKTQEKKEEASTHHRELDSVSLQARKRTFKS